MQMDDVVDVSVIIPCYNCVSTIARAVESIASQSFRPAEVILVDDSSEDATLAATRKLQGHYPPGWIKVIGLERNVGPGEARNAGWDIASCRYIAFLDSDDSWHSRKLEVQYGWMYANPDVVLTGHEFGQIVAWELPVSVSVYCTNSLRVKRVVRTMQLLRNRFVTSSVMLKRNVRQRFQKGKRRSEDYLLWTSIVCGGALAYSIDAALGYRYKAPYGEGGLSEQMWKMHKAELDTHRHLRQSGCVSFPLLVFLYAWTWARFLRRLLSDAYRVWKRKSAVE